MQSPKHPVYLLRFDEASQLSKHTSQVANATSCFRAHHHLHEAVSLHKVAMHFHLYKKAKSACAQKKKRGEFNSSPLGLPLTYSSLDSAVEYAKQLC
jgi:hypothetical protein